MTVGLHAVKLGDKLVLEHDATGTRLGPVPAVPLHWTPPETRPDGSAATAIGVQIPSPAEVDPIIWWLDSMCEAGWSILTAERPLPTEPGVYLDREGDLWRLDRAGGWSCLEGPAAHPVRDYSPFTRLVPAE